MNPKFVSVESPFNSLYPWHVVRNIQYAILSNTHASSLGDVTWTPHICNTQYVKWGINGYISDTLAVCIAGLMSMDNKYFIGREETLRVTNIIRQYKMDKVICYTDYGISQGMKSAIESATKIGIPIEYRTLPMDLKREIIGESFISTAIPLLKYGSIFGFATFGVLKLFI